MLEADRTVLQARSMAGLNFNIKDQAKFQDGLKLIRESLFDGGAALFAADNLITWNRNLSFLREDFFLQILADPQVDSIEKSIIWRTYILLYFAEIASHLEGDFAAFGCYKGSTAEQVIRKLDFQRLGKAYYLYDLFEWKAGDGHSLLTAHDDPDMHANVVKRFADRPFVKVIKGSVPESFTQGFPDCIAFAHIDMNHPAPEAGALSAVLPRLSKGGIVVFDDYGWWGYGDQKIVLDPIAAAHGLKILELPTGQAVLIKP